MALTGARVASDLDDEACVGSEAGPSAGSVDVSSSGSFTPNRLQSSLAGCQDLTSLVSGPYIPSRTAPLRGSSSSCFSCSSSTLSSTFDRSGVCNPSTTFGPNSTTLELVNRPAIAPDSGLNTVALFA